VDRDGYGLVTVRIAGKKTSTRAHRLAYEAFVGEISPSVLVLHTCDVPACCNPDHLRLGDARANTADMDARGRRARGYRKPRGAGEQHGQAKLTEEAVRAIRASTEPLRVLATRYGVSASTIANIRNGRRWCAFLGTTRG